jgi:hypothetical protein
MMMVPAAAVIARAAVSIAPAPPISLCWTGHRYSEQDDTKIQTHSLRGPGGDRFGAAGGGRLYPPVK